MGQISGVVVVEGLPRDSAEVRLYPEAAFSSSIPPVKDTAFPALGLMSSSVYSGDAHGGDGAYRFAGVAAGQYYAGANWLGTIVWDSHNVPTAVDVAANVKDDYGAAGDGVTDDTTAIQTALDAAGVRLLYFPAGTYKVTGLTLTRTVTIYGDGPSSIITAAAPTAANQVILALTTASGIVVRDLAFHGQKTAGTSFTQTGIKVSSSAHKAEIRNVSFSGTSGSNGLTTQIHLQSVDYCLIEGCRFEQVMGTASDYGYGVLCETSTYARVVGNVGIQTATQGRHHFYGSAGASYCVVADNTFVSGTQSQITLASTEAQANCQHNQIVNNVLTSMVTATVDVGAIHLTQKCSFNVIAENQIVSPKFHGIVLEASPNVAESRCDDNVIRGNLIKFADQIAIRLFGCNRALVEGNYIHEASQGSAGTYPGIQVKSNTANAVAADNRILGNFAYGPTNQRSPLVIDSTTPIPTGTIVAGNSFPDGQTRPFVNLGQSTRFDERYTLKQTFSSSALAAAAATNDISLFSLPAGHAIKSTTIKHSEAFTGGALLGYTVSVGIVGNLTKYTSAFDVFQAVANTAFLFSTTQGVENMGVATDIRLAAVSSSANLNAATQGSVDVFSEILRLGHPSLA